jgi:hypothetical protein
MSWASMSRHAVLVGDGGSHRMPPKTRRVAPNSFTCCGSEMRHAMGVAVFSGMLGVTFFGLLTPVFYLTIRKNLAAEGTCGRGVRRRRSASASAELTPSHAGTGEDGARRGDRLHPRSCPSLAAIRAGGGGSGGSSPSGSGSPSKTLLVRTMPPSPMLWMRYSN